MGFLILGVLHVCAIYTGAHIAQLEYIDIWRAIVIAFVSYIAMILIGIPLGLVIVLVPILSLFVSTIILGVSTAIAAKVVLSCDWWPAWIVAITTVVIKLLASWVFSGCA